MALGDNCRSGCRTKDHPDWGTCARAANLRVGWMESTNGLSRVADRKTTQELYEYRDLRSQGIQPEGTSKHAIEAAKRISDTTGKAYNAEKMAPSNLLSSNKVIKAAAEAGAL